MKDGLYFFKWFKERFFLWNQGINILYPNDENVFMFPNHENIEDYYVNCVYPNCWMNIDSKKGWEEKFFLQNQIINSFIPKWRMNLWHSIIKRKEIITWIHVYRNWKMGQREVFLFKPKHRFIYPNRWNEFVVPNHKKKGEYYVNPRLSQLKYELQFQNW